MKLFNWTLIKLQYDEYGRLYLKSFRNVRTNSLSYFCKVRDKYYLSFNPKTDVLAVYDMDRDKLNFLVKVESSPCFAFVHTYSYNFELSDFMKRYIKAQR